MEKLAIRPYARLLSMLGDQLIKNETVALIELVKNAYDADASFCKIGFENFNEEFTNEYSGKIRIEDNGYGMSHDIITTHFLNPATPIKKLGKELKKSRKGRICQGEKGIGRFAILKLGRNITIFSKEKTSDIVHKVVFDFGKYDDEFLTELEKVANNNQSQNDAIFLDQIEIQYEAKKISEFSETDHLFVKYNEGTTILIENLKGKWVNQSFNGFKESLLSFMPFEIDKEGEILEDQDFNVSIYRNRQIQDYRSDKMTKLRDIIADKALYKISGNYDEKEKQIKINYHEAKGSLQNTVITLCDEEILNQQTIDFKGLSIYRKEDDGIEEFYRDGQCTECGDFSFKFYIFDFNSKQYDKFGLNKDEKNIVREHRIFLYRDGIRVHPYGAQDDDWLQIDRHRAETRASHSFSNDQMIGQINITKQGNKKLRDKTSREGIIEDSNAFKQLITLIRGILMYMRVKPFQNYLASQEKKNSANEKAKERIREEIAQLKESLRDDKGALQVLETLEKNVNEQEEVFSKRLQITEQLAGVGLSVEMASHDLMIILDRLKDNIHQTYIDTGSPLTCDLNTVHNNSEVAEGLIGLVYMKMKDLQQLFVSSKQRPKLISVIDIIKKIQSIYAKAYNDKKIKVEYDIIGSPVKAKVIDAVLFQVFINLFDNSLYWTQYSNNKDRLVKVTLDGLNQRVILSDNGPGVQDADAPYIFDDFYSGKGEDGRGLGLYIAKKLLEKSGYEIDIIMNDRDKKLPGANFVVTFITREENGDGFTS